MKKALMYAALLTFSLGKVNAQPAGTIIAYGGEANTIPSGYLICDGKEYPTKQYKELSKAIGTTWGSSGSGKFNVPDLRGLFLRGVNGNRVDAFKDPDVNDRKSLTNGNPGNAVGSVQPDALAIHHHNTLPGQQIPSNGGPSYTPGGAPAFTNGGTQTAEAGTSIETRPKNAYVYWLIKVKN